MVETGKATGSDLHCANNLNGTEELMSKGLITAQVEKAEEHSCFKVTRRRFQHVLVCESAVLNRLSLDLVLFLSLFNVETSSESWALWRILILACPPDLMQEGEEL